MKKCAKCEKKTDRLNRMGYAYYGTDAVYICYECVREWNKLYMEQLKNPSKPEWEKLFEKWIGEKNKVKVVFT